MRLSCIRSLSLEGYFGISPKVSFHDAKGADYNFIDEMFDKQNLGFFMDIASVDYGETRFGG